MTKGVTKLDELKPKQKENIIDVVRAAGINTNDWTSPSDPSKCFNWSFGGDPQPSLLCVWHVSLFERDGLICYEDDSHQWALKLDRIEGRSARSQAKRAHNFHRLVNRAYFGKYPVRIAILEGDMVNESEIGHDFSKVRRRKLDTAEWYVHEFNPETFKALLVRGVRPVEWETSNEGKKPSVEEMPSGDDPEDPVEPPGRHKTPPSTAFNRDPEVRNQVRGRANGICECCKEPGFQTSGDDRYLETHHVIPLSCGGVDQTWNVVAICPNDHKRAHFGKDRIEIRDRLIVFLCEIYPARMSALIEMAKAMDADSESRMLLETDNDLATPHQ